jgi:hypothetical protein
MAEEIAEEGITEEDVVDFLRDRGAKAACLSCGHNSWNISSNRQIMAFAMLGGNYIPGSVMICTNCGFSKFHAHEFISAWKAAKRRK